MRYVFRSFPVKKSWSTIKSLCDNIKPGNRKIHWEKSFMNTSHYSPTAALPIRYHFIGIGGIGMSALAQILLQKGVPVSGSDVAASYITDALQKLGAKIYFEHAEDNIDEPMVIVYNSMIKEDNPEIRV